MTNKEASLYCFTRWQMAEAFKDSEAATWRKNWLEACAVVDKYGKKGNWDLSLAMYREPT